MQGISMANEENLIPKKTLTTEEAKKMGSNGGKKNRTDSPWTAGSQHCTNERRTGSHKGQHNGYSRDT